MSLGSGFAMRTTKLIASWGSRVLIVGYGRSGGGRDGKMVAVIESSEVGVRFTIRCGIL